MPRGRVGGRGQEGFYIQNLQQMQRELRQVDKKWPRELRLINKNIATLAADEAKRLATGPGDGRIGAMASSRAAGTIRGMGEQRRAKIAWGKAKVPWAAGQIMGSLQYKQFPAWVGNSWATGKPGEGPYYLNPAIAKKTDEMKEMLMGQLTELVDRIPGFSGRV